MEASTIRGLCERGKSLEKLCKVACHECSNGHLNKATVFCAELTDIIDDSKF
jgi:hypothetical protein